MTYILNLWLEDPNTICYSGVPLGGSSNRSISNRINQQQGSYHIDAIRRMLNPGELLQLDSCTVGTNQKQLSKEVLSLFAKEFTKKGIICKIV